MLQNKPCEATKRRKKRSCSGRVASNPSGDTRSHTLDRHERARSHAYTPQRDINFRRQKTLIHIHVMAINDPPPQPGYRLALPCVRVCDGATAAASCCWGTRQLYLAIWITNAGKIPKICILLIKGFIDGEKWVKSSVYGASYRPETNETERERWRVLMILVGFGWGWFWLYAFTRIHWQNFDQGRAGQNVHSAALLRAWIKLCLPMPRAKNAPQQNTTKLDG